MIGVVVLPGKGSSADLQTFVVTVDQRLDAGEDVGRIFAEERRPSGDPVRPQYPDPAQ